MSEVFAELLVPFSRIRTRLASIPRMIGRLAPAANPVLETPGMLERASARLEPPWCRIWSASTWVGMVARLAPARGVAVTTMLSTPGACAWLQLAVEVESKTAVAVVLRRMERNMADSEWENARGGRARAALMAARTSNRN